MGSDLLMLLSLKPEEKVMHTQPWALAAGLLALPPRETWAGPEDGWDAELDDGCLMVIGGHSFWDS